VVFTVTVSPEFTGTPTGTVTVSAGKTTLCKIETLSKGKGTCSPTSATVLGVGTYSVVATYSGSAEFDSSSSSAESLKVAKATSKSSLSLSVSSLTYGHETAVVFTVTVSPEFTGTPTGTVTVSAGRMDSIWTSNPPGDRGSQTVPRWADREATSAA
jgi:hypothetical protein